MNGKDELKDALRKIKQLEKELKIKQMKSASDRAVEERADRAVVGGQRNKTAMVAASKKAAVVDGELDGTSDDDDVEDGGSSMDSCEDGVGDSNEGGVVELSKRVRTTVAGAAKRKSGGGGGSCVAKKKKTVEDEESDHSLDPCEIFEFRWNNNKRKAGYFRVAYEGDPMEWMVKPKELMFDYNFIVLKYIWENYGMEEQVLEYIAREAKGYIQTKHIKRQKCLPEFRSFEQEMRERNWGPKGWPNGETGTYAETDERKVVKVKKAKMPPRQEVLGLAAQVDNSVLQDLMEDPWIGTPSTSEDNGMSSVENVTGVVLTGDVSGGGGCGFNWSVDGRWGGV